MHIWRRSYDVPPPGGESLKDTLARALPYYMKHIQPDVLTGKRVLVAAHGNSLRAADHGARWPDAGADPQARTRNRRSGLLPDWRQLPAHLGGDAFGMIIRELTVAEYKSRIPGLADILVDAVDSGAGVTFLWPLEKDVAAGFWRKTAESVKGGGTTQFIAEEDGVIAGTVLLQKVWAANQQHRCEVAKLMVHRDFRRRGVATLLMQALEKKAREMGFILISFDTVAHGPSEQFYRELGFTFAGNIPDYAYSRDGLCDTALFYKKLTPP